MHAERSTESLPLVLGIGPEQGSYSAMQDLSNEERKHTFNVGNAGRCSCPAKEVMFACLDFTAFNTAVKCLPLATSPSVTACTNDGGTVVSCSQEPNFSAACTLLRSITASWSESSSKDRISLFTEFSSLSKCPKRPSTRSSSWLQLSIYTGGHVHAVAAMTMCACSLSLPDRSQHYFRLQRYTRAKLGRTEFVCWEGNKPQMITPVHEERSEALPLLCRQRLTPPRLP